MSGYEYSPEIQNQIWLGSFSPKECQKLLLKDGPQHFSELEGLYKEGLDPVKREEISAALKGKSNITNYLREVLQNAENEVIICTNAEEVNSKHIALNYFRCEYHII